MMFGDRSVFLTYMVLRLFRYEFPHSRVTILVSSGIVIVKSLIPQKNGFEQMCINYANERLQQHFNRHLLKLEQQVGIFDYGNYAIAL